MQRIARDPTETPALRAEVARLLLERGRLLPMGDARIAEEKDTPKTERPIIVVSHVPRKTDEERKAAAKSNAGRVTHDTSPAGGAPGASSAPPEVESAPPRRARQAIAETD